MLSGNKCQIRKQIQVLNLMFISNKYDLHIIVARRHQRYLGFNNLGLAPSLKPRNVEYAMNYALFPATIKQMKHSESSRDSALKKAFGSILMNSNLRLILKNKLNTSNYSENTTVVHTQGGILYSPLLLPHSHLNFTLFPTFLLLILNSIGLSLPFHFLLASMLHQFIF